MYTRVGGPGARTLPGSSAAPPAAPPRLDAAGLRLQLFEVQVAAASGLELLDNAIERALQRRLRRGVQHPARAGVRLQRGAERRRCAEQSRAGERAAALLFDRRVVVRPRDEHQLVGLGAGPGVDLHVEHRVPAAAIRQPFAEGLEGVLLALPLRNERHHQTCAIQIIR